MSLAANVPAGMIATVDMQRALQTVNTGKKAKSKLEKEFNNKKKELEKEKIAIEKMHKELQKQALAMSEKARAKKSAELQQRVMKFQEKTRMSQMEIQQKEAQLTKPIIDKLKEIIKEVSSKKGYTIVLEKNENSVLISPEKDDLTQAVIAAFNKKNK